MARQRRMLFTEAEYNTELPYKAWPVVEDYEKNTSYGPAQDNGKLSFSGRMRSWGGGSYHKDGRGTSVFESQGPGYDEQTQHKVRLNSTDEGHHDTPARRRWLNPD